MRGDNDCGQCLGLTTNRCSQQLAFRALRALIKRKAFLKCLLITLKASYVKFKLGLATTTICWDILLVAAGDLWQLDDRVGMRRAFSAFGVKLVGQVGRVLNDRIGEDQQCKGDDSARHQHEPR